MAACIAIVAAVLIADPGSAADPPEFHWTASQGFLYSSGNNYIDGSGDGVWDFREYAVNAQYEFADNWRVGAQLLGREYGSVGNDRVGLDWALVNWHWRDWLGFKAGQIKVPFGLYHETRDMDALRTEILLPQGVYVEYLREVLTADLGAAAYGAARWSGAGTILYQLQAGERQMDPDDGDLQRLMAESNIEIEDFSAHKPGITAMLRFLPEALQGLRLGATYSIYDYTAEGAVASSPVSIPLRVEVRDNEFATCSIEYSLGNVTAAAEGMWSRYSSGAYVSGAEAPMAEWTDEFSGYYFRCGYRFLDRVEAATGYSYFDATDGMNAARAFAPGAPPRPSHTLEQTDIYFSLRYDATDNLIFKVEHHWLDGTAGIFEGENPDGVEERSRLLAMKAAVVF